MFNNLASLFKKFPLLLLSKFVHQNHEIPSKSIFSLEQDEGKRTWLWLETIAVMITGELERLWKVLTMRAALLHIVDQQLEFVRLLRACIYAYRSCKHLVNLKPIVCERRIRDLNVFFMNELQKMRCPLIIDPPIPSLLSLLHAYNTSQHIVGQHTLSSSLTFTLYQPLLEPSSTCMQHKFICSDMTACLAHNMQSCSQVYMQPKD